MTVAHHGGEVQAGQRAAKAGASGTTGRPAGPASILKAVAVLDAFDGEPSLPLARIAERVGMPKSTVFRLLGSLVSEGLLERRGDAYLLGRRLHVLGQNALGGEPAGLLNAGLPIMTELQRSTGHIVNLAWLQGFDVAYLATLRTRESPPTPAAVGGRGLPANCTALGKVLLAFTPAEAWTPAVPPRFTALTARSLAAPAMLAPALASVRTQGFAVESQESSPDLACVAVPILRRGRAVAALSLSARPGALDAGTLAGVLKRTALHIGRALPSAP
ncbi:IclR family transcriptional regulator [Arthrobacter ginkgonis]|uniref:IclR family transcriptional regulator n=1 Tax=Arthrobacter ginkgonis TaxID=1630594 RepID=A0ABP7C2X9_9MICC